MGAVTSMWASVPKDKHVVIIGGGYGGKRLATMLLHDDCYVTLIDAKDVMHHNVAGVRAVVEPGFAKNIVIPYAPLFGSKFRRGKVTRIDAVKKSVILEDGTMVTYDVLVIATGSVGPMKECSGNGEEIVEKYAKIAEEVGKSKNIVIVGGGPVGVEIAAEIATDYKDKKVTIVHSLSEIMAEGAPEKFVKKIREFIEQNQINLILGDTVINLNDLPVGVNGAYQIKTKQGTTIEADLILNCTGLKINSSAYVNGLSDKMEENGTLRVNKYFQVEGYENIFAIGDCSNAEQAKLAFAAGMQADLLYENLPKFFAEKSMEAWKSSHLKIYMGVSLGRKHGVCATKGGFILPEFIIVNMKSSDLFVERFFKESNLKVPK